MLNCCIFLFKHQWRLTEQYMICQKVGKVLVFCRSNLGLLLNNSRTSALKDSEILER